MISIGVYVGTEKLGVCVDYVYYVSRRRAGREGAVLMSTEKGGVQLIIAQRVSCWV